ncbi:class I SAM-dependent methyltransferase [Cognatilysobacter terrigena]|uniref:class I SAM-dependent methyltransferase n=1 Tax=Cognatilysobacter terrigena TaxID=2488749 RepID=UPI0014150F32|nr:class I SAM-dependent methyltransferase [Lysobacter terrigena]
MEVGHETNAPTIDAWIDQVIASQITPQRSPQGDPRPAFPDATLQVNTTSLSGESAIRQAGAFYEDVTRALQAGGTPLGVRDRVLDFGCGWGRVGRMFLRDVALASLDGLDVDPSFVAISSQLFGTSNFRVCPPAPPSGLETDRYALIVSYSVFSHLSEATTRAWLEEFHRLLRPGGHVAFTTRHDTFFDYILWARTANGVGDYTAALGQLFDDIEAPRAALRAGQFIHATSAGVSGGGVRDESFYGETWVPAQWLVREFGEKFDVVATCFNPERYDQVAYVLRKR